MSARSLIVVLLTLFASSCAADTAVIAAPSAPSADEVSAVENGPTSTQPAAILASSLPTPDGDWDDRCVASQETLSSAPLAVNTALQEATQHAGFADLDVGISVWIDGWGEVTTLNPDLLLAPASNQKLFVAYGANVMLDSQDTFRTTIEVAGDDLVLRAGGDPSLTSANIERLASDVLAAGVTRADRLIVDTALYSQAPRAPGWLDWQIPRYVGPLSGLMLDDNRWTTDSAFVAEPALGNGRRIVKILNAQGIDVSTVIVEKAPEGRPVATHESAPVSHLLQTMLLNSDNQHADLLLMELGRTVSGQGTLAAGAAAVDAELAHLCVGLTGKSDDGSGLSRGNQRSARELQEILRAIRGSEAGERLRAQLPVGGETGTLAARFGGTDAGRVQAKTGTIIGGRSLSGYATTDSGHDVVFSIIVNGEPEMAHASLQAIDGLVDVILRS